jgi:MFS transporter, OFA family, oxalate/formate antiporter
VPEPPSKVKLSQFPLKAWKALVAGAIINLAPAVLYTWGVWAKALVDEKKAVAGVIQKGLNAGWPYLNKAEAATPDSLSIILFFFSLIPGGWIHDKWGPRVSTIIGGVLLSLGFVVTGLLKSYGGLVLGFGILGGMGMGLVSVASFPPAIRWFGPRFRGMAAGLVVGGSGAAALYLPPLAGYLIQTHGLSYSFIWPGVFMGLVIILGGSQLSWPPANYPSPVSPVAVDGTALQSQSQQVEYTSREMLRTRQYYLIVLMFSFVIEVVRLLLAQGGTTLEKIFQGSPLPLSYAWIWFTLGILAKTASPITTGIYSDKIGRCRAFNLNGLMLSLSLTLVPGLFEGKQLLLFMACFFIAYWVFGGCVSLMPAFVADLFGEHHLGMNYGLIVLGCGLGSFIVTRLARVIKDISGLTGLTGFLFVLVIIAIIMSYLLKRSSIRISGSFY